MIFAFLNSHFKLNFPIRIICITQILFSLLIVAVVNDRSYNSPVQQSHQRFGQSQQGVQKNFHYQQKYPTYLRQNWKEINPTNNPTAKFLNTPVNNLNDTTGALVTVQLKQYKNPNLALPNGYTCACPTGKQCPYLQEGSVTCFFSFTIVISAPKQSAQIIESPFIMVPKSPINSGIWTSENVVNMTVKPNTIDIIVHHLGVVINQATGSLEYFNHFIPIDTFVVSLDNYPATPCGTAPNIMQQTISGNVLGTTLQVAYNVQCIDNRYGPSCDLNCTTVSVDKLHAVCISVITGMYHTCSYASDLFEAFDCEPCPFGLVINQTKCHTPNGGSIKYNFISPAFHTWTIVLGCLLGIAMFIMILLVITYAMMKRRDEAKSTTQNRRDVETTRSTISRTHSRKTLLTSGPNEWEPIKIKATTTHDSGASLRTGTSSQSVEERYICSKTVSVGRREAHV